MFLSGKKANLHDEYYVTVDDAYDLENIYVLKNKNDEEKSLIIGSAEHYVCVLVTIEHQKVTEPKENHVLDLDDFKLKDHTGVQIKNINLFSKENGLALETTNFSTQQPINDYTWIGKEIECGQSLQLCFYFKFPKSISVNNTVMVLEADFIQGYRNNKAGTDIVLAYRTEQ